MKYKWHILPVNDLKKHDESMFCACAPRLEKQPNGTFIVVHNSYDGREYTEGDNKKFNKIN